MAKERFLTVLIPISDTDAETTVYGSLSELENAVPASADNADKIYKVSDGTYYRSTLSNNSYSYQAATDREFPYLGNPLEIYDFTYDATRMGTAPTISAQVMWYAEKDQQGNDITLEGLWTRRCHVVFNGENLYLRQIPSSGKSNEDARYKYDLNFVAERIALENVYIYDVVAPFITESPISESPTFSFYGDINELAKRINASLIRSGLSSLERKYVPYPQYPSMTVPYLTYEQWNLVNTDPSSLYGTVFSTEDELLMFYSDIYIALGADYNRYLMSYVYENTNGVYDLSGYQCKIGRDMEGNVASSEDKLVSFDKNTIHEALQQFHDTFELEYYVTKERGSDGMFTGNTFIVVGDCEYDFADYEFVLLFEEPEDWQSNYFEYYKVVGGEYVKLETAETFVTGTYYKKEYSRDEDGVPTTIHPFDYGFANELLSKDKNNTTDKIVTRITGVGSSENIPWYYPNPTPDGWVRPVFTRDGGIMDNVDIDFPSDSEEDRYEKFLKNRIGVSIKHGSLKEIIFGTDAIYITGTYVVVPGSPYRDTVYIVTYNIDTTQIMFPVITLELEYNPSESACSEVYAQMKRGNTVVGEYSSSSSYDTPTPFQSLFINNDGKTTMNLIQGVVYSFRVDYRIPHGSVPSYDVFDYEGYHYDSFYLDAPSVPEDYIDPSTGIWHIYNSSPAYVGENFYEIRELVPFAVWEDFPSAVSENRVYHYVRPVKSGYSTDGTEYGFIAPMPRFSGLRYKDTETETIYKCKTNADNDPVTGHPSDVFDENPQITASEWIRYFVNMNLRVYTNYGWYIGDMVNLSDYGLGQPTISGIPLNETIFDAIEFKRVKWLTPQQSLMPEVYIKTEGERRFYNAHNYWDAENETLLVDTADEMVGEVQVDDKVRNPIYKEEETDADSEHYQFENEYLQSSPYEHIEDFEDIKPTIKEQRGYMAVAISDAVIADWANQYTNYFTKNNDGTFSNATSTYDSSETYYMLLRIDVVEEFAYDETDNDEIWESSDEGSVSGEYKHPYFFARLRPLGFNIFDLALQDDMVVSMVTGNCGSCNFKIGVDENTKKNPVQLWAYDVYDGPSSSYTKVYDAGSLRRYVNTEDLYYDTPDGFVQVDYGLTPLEDSGRIIMDYPSAVHAFKRYKYSTEEVMNGFVGTMKRDGNVHFEGDVVTTGRFIDSQQDTSENYVWVALMKDTDSYGVIMPAARPNYDDQQLDVYIRPKSVTDVHTEQSTAAEDEENADKFVILNIKLPQAYLRRAERKLSRELVKYMYENNAQKFNFSIKFSRIFIAENEDVDFNLNENSVLYVLFNNNIYRQYAKHYTYKMSHNEPLPEISVDMNEELSVSRTLMQRWDEGRRMDGRSISSRVGSMIRQMQGRIERTTLSRTDDTILSGNVYIRDTNTSLLEIEGGEGVSAEPISISEIDEITSN